MTSSVREVVSRLGDPDGVSARSRNDRRAAILRYGWVQLFVGEDGDEVVGIGVYPVAGERPSKQPLLGDDTVELLQSLTPVQLVELLSGESVEVLTGDTNPPSALKFVDEFTPSNLPATVRDLRVRIASGAEAIFDRVGQLSPWELQKILYFPNNSGDT